jgi:hypothetical protein
MAGVSRDEIPAGAPRIAWWGKLAPRFDAFLERVSLRWIDPAGRVRATAPAERLERPYVGGALDVAGDPGVVGIWTVEALIDDDVIDRRTVRVQSAPAPR